jgi:hypothetical protein
MADSSYSAQRVIQVSNRSQYIDYIAQFSSESIIHALHINSLLLNRRPISLEMIITNTSTTKTCLCQFVNNKTGSVVDYVQLDPEKEVILKYYEGFDLAFKIQGDVKIQVTGEVL